MLELYREALRIRREHPGFRDETLAWREASDGVLHFGRSDDLEVVVNLTSEPVAIPRGRRVVLASVPLGDGRLPGDAAAWLDGAE
jgi:alpha-glucosidase